MNSDTIAAIATSVGNSAVGIIRISGPKALGIAEQITKKTFVHKEAQLATFYDDQNEALDQGLVLYFKAPHSFTGEEVIELQGHGGMLVLSEVLKNVFKQGARSAHPGEFSQRAFLNGKLDLIQAEAISDLIQASSIQAAKSAVRSLSGEFSEKIHQLLRQWIELRMFVEAAIDFPEEEIDFLSDGQIEIRLEALNQSMNELKHQVHQGKALNEGIHVAIVGAPNAGKSSLLNVLLGEDRAIVTEIAGTTRDILQEKVIISGVPFIFYDTAGIRETEDIVEQEGVRRAQNILKQADIVLVLFDGSRDTQQQVTEELRLEQAENQKIVYVENKIDLSTSKKLDTSDALQISAKTKQGIEQLKIELLKLAGVEVLSEHVFIARSRHVDALSRVHQTLEKAREHYRTRSGELMAEELRLGQLHLNEITGEFTSDDLLGKIFSQFCIGK